MTNPYQERTETLAHALAGAGVEAAILSDPDTIAYYAGYWGYLGVEFGRPTLMVVAPGHTPVVLTPLMESQMCAAMSWITDIRPWSDGGQEWRTLLVDLLTSYSPDVIGIEERAIPNAVATQVRSVLVEVRYVDVAAIIARQRMIKSSDEIAVMRQAGEVAIAMMEAARETISPDIPEYEVALAAMQAGTRQAATLLNVPRDRFVSPLIHNLQILQSGSDTCMVHRRASLRRLKAGDPVYLCFCGMVSFRNYKLGFDRQFFVRAITDEQAKVQDVALRAQQAALRAIRPGVRCEAVNAAAEEVYADNGFSPGYRTGRAVGLSLLESPELKRGETRTLEAGMTFAVDGGTSSPSGQAGRIGDSIVVTPSGFEYLTPYPRDLTVL